MSKPLSYEVGEQGRFQGEVVYKSPTGRYVEVLASRGSRIGECTVYVYEIGPRGGANVLESHTTPHRMRAKARRLELDAARADEYVAEVVKRHG